LPEGLARNTQERLDSGSPVVGLQNAESTALHFGSFVQLRKVEQKTWKEQKYSNCSCN